MAEFRSAPSAANSTLTLAVLSLIAALSAGCTGSSPVESAPSTALSVKGHWVGTAGVTNMDLSFDAPPYTGEDSGFGTITRTDTRVEKTVLVQMSAPVWGELYDLTETGHPIFAFIRPTSIEATTIKGYLLAAFRGSSFIGADSVSFVINRI